ncbi:Gag-pol polyprotein [Melia azedarach]|uniref:Gag-pol polyprotein n=1 Tax=Melia azedarach TaxID=155640 RepID=A0ACC1X073_MELAZ|nr:Gag-pol polyprotein [Melia azedarach]
MPNSEAPRGSRREVTREPGQSSHPPSAPPQDEYAESQNVRTLDPGPSRKGKEKAATSRDVEAEKAKEGQSDPVAHVEIFQNLMLVQGVPDEIMCKVFPTTLSGPARTWYKKLPSGSIRDFTTFASKFVLHFQGAKPPTKDPSSLQYIKQRGKEPLHEYVKRYHDEVMQMRVYEEPETLRNFWYNLHTGPLWVSFEERPPTSYREAHDRAVKQIAIEEKRNLKREREKAEDFSDKGKDKKKQDVRPSRPVPPQQGSVPRQQDSQRAPLPYRRPPQPRPETLRPQPPPQPREVPHSPRRESVITHAYHPLNTTREQVFYAIRDKDLLTRPPKLITPLGKRNLKRYCDFHEEYGHSTADCFNLREQIQNLINNGYLKEFLLEVRRKAQVVRQAGESSGGDQGQPGSQVTKDKDFISTISGGPTLEGDSRRARKAHAREPSLARHHQEVNFTERSPKLPRLGLNSARMQQVTTPLSGFMGDQLLASGSITLPVTLGKDPSQLITMVDFVVIDHPSSYNVILGRPFLTAARGVVSTYHLKLKFPVGNQVGVVKGDQLTVRRCYASSVRRCNQVFTLDPRVSEVEQRGEPVEELEAVLMRRPRNANQLKKYYP